MVSKVKDYTITDLIGTGLSSKVYKAMKGGNYYAVKIISSQFIAKAKKFVVRELFAYRELSHPNILKIHEVFKSKHHLYIIMDYIPITLLDFVVNVKDEMHMGIAISPLGGLPEEIAYHFVYQILLGVEFVHKSGIAHRDIKLENILLSGCNTLTNIHTYKSVSSVVTDFGLCTMGMSRLEPCPFGADAVLQMSSTSVVGSQNYMAPEILQSSNYSPQPTDIWSLGVLFHVLLTGKFPDISNNYTLEYIPPEGIQPQYATALKRMICINPATRPTVSECISIIACVPTPFVITPLDTVGDLHRKFSDPTIECVVTPAAFSREVVPIDKASCEAEPTFSTPLGLASVVGLPIPLEMPPQLIEPSPACGTGPQAAYSLRVGATALAASRTLTPGPARFSDRQPAAQDPPETAHRDEFEWSVDSPHQESVESKPSDTSKTTSDGSGSSQTHLLPPIRNVRSFVCGQGVEATSTRSLPATFAKRP